MGESVGGRTHGSWELSSPALRNPPLRPPRRLADPPSASEAGSSDSSVATHLDRMMLIPRTLKFRAGTDREPWQPPRVETTRCPISGLLPFRFRGTAPLGGRVRSRSVSPKAYNPNAYNAIQQAGESGDESNRTLRSIGIGSEVNEAQAMSSPATVNNKKGIRGPITPRVYNKQQGAMP